MTFNYSQNTSHECKMISRELKVWLLLDLLGISRIQSQSMIPNRSNTLVNINVLHSHKDIISHFPYKETTFKRHCPGSLGYTGEKEFTLSLPNSKYPQIFPTHHQPFHGCPESLDAMGTMDSFQISVLSNTI